MPLPAAPAVFRGVSCRRLPLVGSATFSGSYCLSCSCGGGFTGFCTLCQGAPNGVVTALWVAVWWCLLAPHSSSFVTCSVISSCGSQPLWVLCSVHCLVYLALGWVRFWPAVSTAPVRCGVCSLGCPSCLVLLLTLFVLHLLLQWGGLVTGLWPLLLLLCVGLLWGLCCAVLSPWALARPTLSGLRLRIPMVSWSMLLVFSWTLSWGSFLSLPVVTDGLG